MPAPRSWFGGPKRLLWSFAVVLLLPAVAVGWLGLRLIEQDRALELRQQLERRDAAADRLIAGLERAVSATERQLAASHARIDLGGDADAVVVTFRTEVVEVSPPSRLLFTPTPPAAATEPTTEFAEGEAAEFGGAPAQAVAVYRVLARSPVEAVQAGALVRLARTLRKMGRHAEALGAYDALSRVTDAHVAGLPAELVGRRARLVLLAEMPRVESLREGARALQADLVTGRWLLDKGTFEAYEAQVRDWAGEPPPDLAERRALSDAVDRLWQEWTRGGLRSAGRTTYANENGGITALWHPGADGQVVALLAGPRFRSRAWLASAGLVGGLDVTFVRPDARPAASAPDGAAPVLRRSAAETGLPWTLLFTHTPAALDPGSASSRQAVILSGLGLLMLVVIGGAVVVARGVAHELEVARLQSDFVSAVSHEFRTPLTSLQQFTELLNDEQEPPPDKRHVFYHAQARAVSRLQHLVESLLDFGRMEAGAYTYRMARVPIGLFVTGVVDAFRRDGAPAGFTVACTVAPEVGDVVADGEALGRALHNLLENAVKYSDDGRLIDVRTVRTGDTVAISVRDDGLGIPQAEQSRIFTKFVRGAASRTHGINGSGIGLAMARELVRAHGGDIAVESDGRRGSTFTVRLPVAPPAVGACMQDGSS